MTSPRLPMHPALSTLPLLPAPWGLHFKKSDRSGEGLVFKRETSLVLVEPESWQFVSVTECEK